MRKARFSAVTWVLAAGSILTGDALGKHQYWAATGAGAATALLVLLLLFLLRQKKD